MRASIVLVLASGCALAHESEVEPVDAGHDATIVTMQPDAAIANDAFTLPPPSCGPQPVGTPCTGDSECSIHAFFSPAICMPPVRGGGCTSMCMVDSDCGACGACVMNATGDSPVPGWYGFCVRACDPSTPCASGQVCAAIDATRFGCFPDCRVQPGVCRASRCDPMLGVCDAGCGSDAECSFGSRCDAGRCMCPSGACACADDASCGPGHTCNPMIGCCEWTPGSTGLCG